MESNNWISFEGKCYWKRCIKLTNSRRQSFSRLGRSCALMFALQLSNNFEWIRKHENVKEVLELSKQKRKLFIRVQVPVLHCGPVPLEKAYVNPPSSTFWLISRLQFYPEGRGAVNSKPTQRWSWHTRLSYSRYTSSERTSAYMMLPRQLGLRLSLREVNIT